MRKKLRILSVLVVLVLTISGCGVSVIDLSDEQRDMVSEYIAAAILKNDTGYETRLVYNPEVLEPEPTPGPTPLPLVPSEPDATAAPASGDTQDGDTPTEAPEVLADSMDALFDGTVGVRATEYKVINSYDKDIYVVEPSDGKKLLMVTFEVTNGGGKDSKIALQNQKISYRAQVDGSVYEPEQTIVENDLQFLKTVLKAGKSQKALLFFEIDGKKAGNVKIIGTKGDTEVTMQVP